MTASIAQSATKRPWRVVMGGTVAPEIRLAARMGGRIPATEGMAAMSMAGANNQARGSFAV